MPFINPFRLRDGILPCRGLLFFVLVLFAATAVAHATSSPIEIVAQLGQSKIKAIVFSHDGRFIASGSADRTLKLWEAGSGREVRTFTGHTGSVYRGHGVFTYALLDALDHADVNKNGLIEVSELADYIDQKVPDFSFEAFKLRQIPQRNIVGNNVALTNKMIILNGSSVLVRGATADVAAPIKPTHVVIAPVDVLTAPSADGIIVEKLAAGTQVTLVEAVNGWIAIARNGKKIGFVKEQRF